jgi:hypothetical protein
MITNIAAIIFLYIIGCMIAFVIAKNYGDDKVYEPLVEALPWPIRLPIFLVKVIITMIWDICVVIKNDFKWFKY